MKNIAHNEANNQIEELEDNFINSGYFDEINSKTDLTDAYQELVDNEDEPWWHCWEMISDEIPDLIEEDEDLDAVSREAKVLLKSTFEQAVLAALENHFQIG